MDKFTAGLALIAAVAAMLLADPNTDYDSSPVRQVPVSYAHAH